MNKRVLVIGSTSELARMFISYTSNVDLSLTSRQKDSHFYLDLEDLSKMSTDLCKEHFDVAIVFAAMTNVRKCEQYPQLAMQINSENLICLHQTLKVKRWILLSSNCVFDGTQKVTPINSSLSPFNIYGKTKASMESYFMKHAESSSIVRLTKVLTPNFTLLSQMLSKVKNGQKVMAFNNMYFCPVSSMQVVEFIVNLVNSERNGLFQLSGCTDVSYFKALSYLAKKNGLSTDLILPVDSNIPCPKYTCLDVGDNERDLNFKPRFYENLI